MTALEKLELAIRHFKRAAMLISEARLEAPTENLRWNLGGIVVRSERERRKLEKHAVEMGARG